MFDTKDSIHLKNLMGMIRDKLVLNDLDCSDVSKVFKAFEWLQGLEEKMSMSIDIQRDHIDLKEALKSESEGLVIYIEELESEIKELKAPKKKTRKKKTK